MESLFHRLLAESTLGELSEIKRVILLNSNDLRIIEKAATLCEQNPEDRNRQRVAAIITDSKGNILSTGLNSYQKTHPIQARYAEKTKNSHNVFLHAEIAALVKNRYSEKASRIYIARIHRNGDYALAKPCPICSMAIKEAGIQDIIYTAKSKVIEKRGRK